MDDLERRLRDSLAHQVEMPPHVPGLPDTVVRRGRRTRRRQALGSSAALVAALVTTGVLLLPDGRDDAQVATPVTPTPTSSPSPTPTPTYLDVASQAFLDALPQGDGPRVAFAAGRTLVDGDRRVDVGGEIKDVQAWSDGVVLVAELAGRRTLLRWTRARSTLESIEQEEVGSRFAVTVDGARVAYMKVWPEGVGTKLHRVVREISTGRELAVDPEIRGGQPGAPTGDAVGFVDGEVLWSVFDEDAEIVGVEGWDYTEGTTRTVGGGRYTAALATSRDGLVALTRTSDTCHEVSELPVRDGLWSTCEAYPVAFSPDSQRLLTAPGDSVVVVAARTGAVQRELALPFPGVTAYRWESKDAVLALVRTQAGGLQPLRCIVTREQCERAGPALDLTGEMTLVVGARG